MNDLQVKCSYYEYSNASQGSCVNCKSFANMSDALQACCSDTLCSGVTFTNSNASGTWIYELRTGNSIANSKTKEYSYFRYL